MKLLPFLGNPRGLHGRVLATAAALCTLLVSHKALATYSIVAVDTRDGSVGGAVASCVPLSTVELVYGSVPGKGALITQSYLLDKAHSDGLQWIEQGKPAAEILASLLDPSYDMQANTRQYAVVLADGQVETFTGPGANGYAGATRFELEHYRVAVQGNFLTGPEVLAQAQEGFSGAGCDLAERLLLALEGAEQQGGGDVRCRTAGANSPAESALLVVDPAGQPSRSFVHLRAEVLPREGSPTALLRQQYAAFRAANACPDATSSVPPPATADEPGASCAFRKAGPGGAAFGTLFFLLAAIARRRRVNGGFSTSADC